MLVVVHLTVAGTVFALLYGGTSRSACWAKCIAAVLGWLAIAFVEGLAWAWLSIDNYYCRRPDSPWLVPANLIYAGLWVVFFIGSALQRHRAHATRKDQA